MTVTLDQVLAGLIKYIDSEIAPKAQGFTKFAVYFVAPSIPNILRSKFVELQQSGVISDLLDENGNIKLDDAYKRAKDAFQKSGKILLPKFNLFVDITDVEMLYNFIKNS